MKTKFKLNRVSLFIALIASTAIFFRCDKENEEMLYKISGIVTYVDEIPADGAVVTVSSDESGVTVINKVVAGSDGAYLLEGLAGGTYYLTASYNTENQNNLKSEGFNFVTAEPDSVEVSGNITHDITLVNKVGGNEIVNTEDGSWWFDKAHSNVNWATAYMGENALLTGKFNAFNVAIDFDESNPEATTISAWVQLSSANTGEPGRDYLGGCLNGYLGVVLDTLPGGDHYISDTSTDTAYFKSMSVSVFGDGYKAVGDFTFKKITKSVDLYFNYIGQADHSSAGDGSSIRGGFSGEFEFLAISDFLVTSTSIADKINVSINANYRKR
jgi:polyisoprenoid-binding protein YceI